MKSILHRTRSKRVRRILVGILGSLLILQSIMVVAAVVRNRFFLQTDQYAAILLSDDFITRYDYWVSPGAYFAASPSWTHYFNNRRLKTRWFFRATSSDLKQVVQDPNCQSVVLMGHGTYHSWDATDSTVTNIEMAQYVKGAQRKTGEWLQLTCAQDEGFDCRLGELVMPPENVFTYDRKVNSCYLILDAILGFRTIKSMSKVPRPQGVVEMAKKI